MGHSFHRRRSSFARGLRRCLLSRRYSIYERCRHLERTPGKRHVLPFGCEILPEVKEVKLPYPYFTGFRACAQQPTPWLWITSPYGTLLRGIHRIRDCSHTAVCSPSAQTTLLCRSMTRRANRATLRPAHQSPYSIALSSRDGSCTGLYADTPMIPAQHRISPPNAAADMNEKVSSRETERATGSINPTP